MKNTEDIILRQTGEDSNVISVNQSVETKNLFKALLNGEITQEVEELRYKTYLVDKESRNWEYYTPTLALKKNNNDTKFLKYDDSDGLELITSQLNDLMLKGIDDSIKEFEKSTNQEYTISVKRDFTPRYRLEKFTTRLDVKKLDETHVILDFFVSSYSKPDDFTTAGFINEVKRIKDGQVKSDIIDMEEVSFITFHAYKLYDHLKFVFKNICFREIVEFDGHYILRFKAAFSTENRDPVKRYFSKTMNDKYANKEKKQCILNILDYEKKEIYVCESCGKEVLLDRKAMDELESYAGRDVTEETVETENKGVAEFIDMQISEQMFGKRLCSSCLKKYMEENNLI